MIVRDVLDNGVRLITESMDHVRSVSMGVWLARGSRHEPAELNGIAHFTEHMFFKGSETRSAEAIAQAVDSVGGHIDAFTSKEYAGYYVQVLDEHVPLAWDVLSDMLLHPAFRPDDIAREKKVILEEIKMVEDTPDDLVHELFAQQMWSEHPLGRPILGTRETVEALTDTALFEFYRHQYAPANLVIVVVGNIEHARVRELVDRTFGTLAAGNGHVEERPPAVTQPLQVRVKDLEQSHVCLGAGGYPQTHKDRYASYVLNTVLGGSMSSRLFQNVREKRGLAYSVSSGLSAYRDTGAVTVYAGCANEAVPELIDVVVTEIKGVKAPLPADELRRAKDHLKGSLMLGLESTSSRMSHLARQEMYFNRQFSLDETLAEIERVSVEDVQRVARELFSNGSLGATVIGADSDLTLTREALDLG